MATNRLASRMKKQSNITKTENGAKTYRSTTNRVLDFFYLAPSRQGQDNTGLFSNALDENPILALKAAFYLRDIRQGKGQRKTFRDILSFLDAYNRRIFNQIVPFVAEYGRWDDILPYYHRESVRNVVLEQLNADSNSDHPSLLAKWLPSENASSLHTRKLAREWMEILGLTPRLYRQMLTELRRRIGIVESQMSAQDWGSIEYPRVPSRAMRLYRKAFERHDEDRFTEFVSAAMRGDVVIQAKTLYPHEIVAEFLRGRGDNTLEAQWNQLPNYFADEPRNVLIVVDTSSSMNCRIAGGSHTAMDVSISLGIYCAERNQGPFHNLIMTFNDCPEIVDITSKSLRARVNKVKGIPWGGSTNLQGTFAELLRYAKEVKAEPSEMPESIVIITDGEFNSQVHGLTNFEGIQEQYRKAKYKMPHLTFWNVNARHNQAPVTKNENGVFLVGGFSAETIGKVLNAEATDPETLMLEILNSDRYSFVDGLKL